MVMKIKKVSLYKLCNASNFQPNLCVHVCTGTCSVYAHMEVYIELCGLGFWFLAMLLIHSVTEIECWVG